TRQRIHPAYQPGHRPTPQAPTPPPATATGNAERDAAGEARGQGEGPAVMPHGDDELSPDRFGVEDFEWLNAYTVDPVSRLAVLLFLTRHTDGWFGDGEPEEWKPGCFEVEA